MHPTSPICSGLSTYSRRTPCSPSTPWRVFLLLFALPLPLLAETARPWSFENDIEPILTRFGCNTAGCHGKAEGQNGFKLSVFGFDPEGDYRALVMEGRGRRVFPASPERSLVLRKASGEVPHGGGVRLPPERAEYARLLTWIAEGAPFGAPDAAHVVALRVRPEQQVLAPGDVVTLQVEATWSDGRVEDVTPLATYQSNQDTLLRVDELGRIEAGETPGTAAVMASFLGQVAVFQAILPRSEPVPAGTEYPEANFIDRHVNEQLRRLQIAPSPRCDDATFLRRVFLDLIGTLPTAEEARAFLADSREDKRRRLVDLLLERPEYVDYATLRWADLLRVNRRELGRRQAREYYEWIRGEMAANRPWDAFAHELVAARGPLRERPAGNFYRAVTKPNEQASALAQTLLGVRIECAQCHHHPWDRWGQDDYLGMQAYFSPIAFKETPRGAALLENGAGKAVHPRSGRAIAPHPLGAAGPKAGDETAATPDREQLADWLTSPENPWFARNLANRIWAQLLGRGIVEPVDDFRSTNPPSHPELLDALSARLVESGFDPKTLIREIAASEAYQRSPTPNATNEQDEQSYSRFPFKRLDAEVLLDAVCEVTGVGEKFAGVPEGPRAIQLWDSHVPHYFLSLFGRPSRETACRCERVVEPSVGQILHVLNSPELQAKLSHAGGRVSRLAESTADDGAAIDELYFTCMSRPPSAQEREAALAHVQGAPDRLRGLEDVTWSLLNSLEFLFNH